jgi:predicted PurR-regulated permease PerM
LSGTHTIGTTNALGYEYECPGLWSIMSTIETSNSGPTAANIADVATVPIQTRSVAMSIVAALALVVLLRYGRQLFVPLALAILVAFALNPFVSLLERVRVPRMIGSAFVVLVAVALLASGSYALRSQAEDVIDGLPEAIANIREQVNDWQAGKASPGALEKLKEAAKEIERTTAEATDQPVTHGVTKVQIAQNPFRLVDYLWSGSRGLAGFVSDAVMVTFLVFFLLSSGDLFKRKLVRIIGSRLSDKRETVEALNEITHQVERFLFIQIMTSIGVAVCMSIALWSFGIRQPGFWGVVAGAVSSIPFIGPLFMTLAVALIAFLQFHNVAIGAETALIPIAIFSLEGMLVKPAVMGKAGHINGAAMFIGLLFWSWTWGLIGMLVAVPLMMVLKSVSMRVESLRAVGELLDER